MSGNGNEEMDKQGRQDKKKPSNKGKNSPKSKPVSNPDMQSMCAGMRMVNSMLRPNSAERLQRRRFNPDIRAEGQGLLDLLRDPETPDQRNAEDQPNGQPDQGAEPGPSRTPPGGPTANIPDNSPDGETEASANATTEDEERNNAPKRPLPPLNLTDLHERIRAVITDLETIDDQQERNRLDRRSREKDLQALLIAADGLQKKELLKHVKREEANASPKLATAELGPKENGEVGKGDLPNDENASGTETGNSVKVEVPLAPPQGLNENDAPPQNNMLQRKEGNRPRTNQNANGAAARDEPSNANLEQQGRININFTRSGASSIAFSYGIGYSVPMSLDGLPVPAWAGQQLGISPELYSGLQNYPAPTGSMSAMRLIGHLAVPSQAGANNEANAIGMQNNCNPGAAPNQNPNPALYCPLPVALPVSPLMLPSTSATPSRGILAAPVAFPMPWQWQPAANPTAEAQASRACQTEPDPNQQAQQERPAPKGNAGSKPKKRSAASGNRLEIFIQGTKRRAVSNSDDRTRSVPAPGTGRAQAQRENERSRRPQQPAHAPIMGRVQAQPRRAEALGRPEPAAPEGRRTPNIPAEENNNLGEVRINLRSPPDHWYGGMEWVPLAWHDGARYDNEGPALFRYVDQQGQLQDLQPPSPMLAEEFVPWQDNAYRNGGMHIHDQRTPPPAHAQELRFGPGHHLPDEERGECRCCMGICTCHHQNRQM